MKSLTVLILLPAISLAQQPSARAAWAWATSQEKQAALAQLQKQDKKQTWICDVCNGAGRGGFCTNCDGTGKVDYDPGKDGPKLPAKKAPALLVVEMHPSCQIWVQGVLQYGTGEMVRAFESPPLEVGKTYVYSVRVRTPDGKEEKAEVEVWAGRASRVSFTRIPPVDFRNVYTGPRMSVAGGC